MPKNKIFALPCAGILHASNTSGWDEMMVVVVMMMTTTTHVENTIHQHECVASELTGLKMYAFLKMRRTSLTSSCKLL